MKLASLKDGSRDGRLAVVSRDLTRYTDASFLVRTLQAALDDWQRIAPHLSALAESLAHGSVPSSRFHEHDALSPLPRAFCRVAGTDSFIAPRDPINLSQSGHVRVAGGVSAIVDDVSAGADGSSDVVRLMMLSSDVILDGSTESDTDLARFQSLPSSAFSPVAVTPDELGSAWVGGRIALPLLVGLNGKPHGRSEAGSDLFKLIAGAARTRPLGAGTILGLADKDGGATVKVGDTVRVEMKDESGHSIFGAIEQVVQQAR